MPPPLIPIASFWRIAVNYLRHRLAEYDEDFGEVAGKVGSGNAQQPIRRKVLAAISDAYPWLAGERERRRYR
jgi:hypothetical protein